MLVKSDYPHTEGQEKDDLSLQAKDYAFSRGISMRCRECPGNADYAAHAPFLLFPTTVSRDCYRAAQSVQKHMDVLVHKLAHDHQFLKEALASTILVDEFTKRIWDIYETVRKEGVSQPYSLALNRCDYMFDCDPEGCDTCITKTSIKLIEINTIACSFGGLSQQVSELHKFVIQAANLNDKLPQLPENTASDGLGEAMVKAWQYYDNAKSVILFVVTQPEQNTFDQRHLEYSVHQASAHRVRVIRRTLQDLTERGALSDDRRLLIDGMEVAVVYFRAGYVPEHFTENDWAMRLTVERSKAIKCPSANYQLVGTKKVQQVLAKPGVLEKYISDPSVINEIRKTFVGQFSLDLDTEGDRNTAMGIANPSKFVLKPQREGGGNNFFGDDVRTKLQEMNGSKERSAYILMERVWPVQVYNYPVRVAQPVERCEMISELGIFGTLVGTRDEILFTSQQGHILRTKSVGIDEGGVATGFSCLDSPLLVTGSS